VRLTFARCGNCINNHVIFYFLSVSSILHSIANLCFKTTHFTRYSFTDVDYKTKYKELCIKFQLV